MDGDSFSAYSQAIDELKGLREKLSVQQQHQEVLTNLTTFLMLNLPGPVNNPILSKARKETAALTRTFSSTVRGRFYYDEIKLATSYIYRSRK